MNISLPQMVTEHSWLILIAMTIHIFLNGHKLAELFETSKRRKIKAINNALEDPEVSSELKQHLRKINECEHFRLITRIDMKPKDRDEVLKAWAMTNYDFNLIPVLKAKPYLKFEERSVKTQISTFEHCFYWYNFLIVLSFSFGSLFSLVALVSVITTDLSKTLVWLFFTNDSRIICSSLIF